jgi:IS6 family transposase
MEYLYRAVDSAGQTIELMLSAKHDVSAAKRFFKKLMRADHRRLPFTIGTDKHASYPEAFATSIKEKVLPPDCKLRRVKYLNNVIEQDYSAIRGHVLIPGHEVLKGRVSVHVYTRAFQKPLATPVE